MFIKMNLRSTPPVDVIVNTQHIVSMYPNSDGGTVVSMTGTHNSLVVAQSMSWIVEILKAPENALL